MKMKHRLEDEERKKTIDSLLKIIEQETPQKECSSLHSCLYIRECVDLGEITNLEAYGYLTLICERYPGACKLNLVH
ncbi:MAG: hypothetical protein ABIH28_01140 [archaeon]